MPHRRSPAARAPRPARLLRARRGRVSRRLAASLFAILVVAGIWLLVRRPEVTPPEPIGAPVRVTTASGDAVFLLTSHWRTHVRTTRGSGATRRWTNLHVDLWKFDPATAQPIWRRNLLTERSGARTNLALLGAEGDRLWVYVRGVQAVSTDDGTLLGDAARLESSNPALQGRLPTDPRYYAFGPTGLTLTATDAQAYRVNGATFAAMPATRGAPPPARADSTSTVVVPAVFAPGSTHSFMERGLSWPGNWLGLLTDEEAQALANPLGDAEPGSAMAEHRTATHGPPRLDGTLPVRYRLWHARVTQASRAPAGWPENFPNNWGTRDVYSDITPLPESGEFLQAGLLGIGVGDVPIWVREPDGVLVLHRERVGAEGTLRLTRIAGPAGRTVWDADLPLSVVQSVLRGDRSLVLTGVQQQPSTRKRRHPSDPTHESHTMVVSVDLATGKVGSFDVSGSNGGR